MQSHDETPTLSSAAPKPYISGALKHVPKEQHPQTLAAAAVWKQRFAADRKWEGVVERIRSVGQEVPMQIQLEEGTRDADTKTSRVSVETRRPRVLSDLVPSLKRDRGRVTLDTSTAFSVSPPLSSPFSRGGFWESLTPTPTTPTPTPTSARRPSNTTPTPAPTPTPTFTPTSPLSKTAYKTLTNAITTTALHLCATRLHNTQTPNNNNANTPIALKKSMLRKKHLHAATHHLLSRLLFHTPPLDPSLPSKLAALAAQAAHIQRDNSITGLGALVRVESWLRRHVRTGALATVLDAQRAGLQDVAARRRILCAAFGGGWEVAVLTGLLGMGECCGGWEGEQGEGDEEEDEDEEDEDEDEDDGGGGGMYEYGDFVRALGGEEGVLM
ncbi:hypothetical protein J1614_005037 [Plenodomus biglobosus]|nr:hypothetical protein J1614_005037 [Plenodomus biglobosus]